MNLAKKDAERAIILFIYEHYKKHFKLGLIFSLRNKLSSLMTLDKRWINDEVNRKIKNDVATGCARESETTFDVVYLHEKYNFLATFWHQ